jgi:uncharacterized membrane protein YfcA
MIGVSIIGVLAGTFFGLAVLKGIRHQQFFYRIVGVLVFVLGVFMFAQAARD